MEPKFINVFLMYLALATVSQFTYASSSNLVTPNRIKRQNNICLNHTAGEFDRNPDDCRSFYLCLENGQAVMAPCPPTMLFNPISKLCDTADNVNCEIDISSNGHNKNTNSNNNNGNTGINDNKNNNNNNDNENELLNASRYCASHPPDQNRIVFLGSSSNCQQYFICYYGQAVLQECSANLHWNANTAKCDMPESAGCPLWTPDTVTSTIGSTNGNGGTDNSADGSASSDGGELINCPIYGQHVFPHVLRCDYFIYCVKGHAILQQCPFYYHFDIVSKSCKLRTAAICVRDLNINFRQLIVKV